GARFGGIAELVGFGPPSGPVVPGRAVTVRLYWRALATPTEDYTAFLHLVDAEDRIRGQLDRPPGNVPSRTWLPGETLVDERQIVVASDAAPGAYRLAAGLYL